MNQSHVCIYPPFWTFFPFRSPQCMSPSSLCYIAGSHQLSVLYILIVSIVYMCQFQSPDSFHLPFPFGIHIFVLYVCVSISTLQIRLSIPFFFRFHIYALIYICFLLSDFHHSVCQSLIPSTSLQTVLLCPFLWLFSSVQLLSCV